MGGGGHDLRRNWERTDTIGNGAIERMGRLPKGAPGEEKPGGGGGPKRAQDI